jgi:hypothetical protein
VDDILRLAGGPLRIPTTSGLPDSHTSRLTQTTGESQVRGWAIATEYRGRGVVSTDEVSAPTQTPATWLSALRTDCHDDPRPNQRAREPSIDCSARRFESLLGLVPTASTSILQELKSVFDGSEYKDRPVGSSSRTTRRSGTEISASLQYCPS